MKKSTEVFLETILTQKTDEVVELAKAIANCCNQEVTLTGDGLYTGKALSADYYWKDLFNLDSESIDKYMLRCLSAVIVDKLNDLGYGDYSIEEEYPYEDDKSELYCIIKKTLHG